jgi:predicted dehydrogenase
MEVYTQGVLKGAMIGCGWFAANHLHAWRRIPDVQIIAAADLSLDRARKFAERAYSSAEEMLDHEQVDFVDIATHAASHLALVRMAAERKIPIICQKPIAPDWAGALQIVSAAESAGVRLMIHENWRWQPWYRQAHEMIARGEIGAPTVFGFRFRRRDGLLDDPYADQSYFRQERRLILQQTLVHQMDTARFLFGEIDSVFAQTSRRNTGILAEDQAIIVVSLESGVHGWIDGHRFLDPDPPGPVMGDAVFEGEDGVISVLPTGDVYRNNVLVWRNDIAPTLYGGDCVRATQAHFISCLRDGSPFESAGRSYLRTFAAVEAGYRSAMERRNIRLAEILETSHSGGGHILSPL